LNANGIPTEPIEGGNGQFDVMRDDERIFSKHEAGRFPEEGEVLSALQS